MFHIFCKFYDSNTMRLSNIIYTYFPILVFIFLLAAENIWPTYFPGLTSSEYGLVETTQAIVLAVAFGAGVHFILTRRDNAHTYERILITLATAACAYIFLEEISYGQHYFEWLTPNAWTAMNDQNETNLHNTSSWLDQKPRLLLEVGVIIGGLIIPTIRRFKNIALFNRFDFLLPDRTFTATALIAILPRMYERVIDIIHHKDSHYHLFVRTSEVQELYFYFFMFLYFLMLYRKSEIRGYVAP